MWSWVWIEQLSLKPRNFAFGRFHPHVRRLHRAGFSCPICHIPTNHCQNFVAFAHFSWAPENACSEFWLICNFRTEVDLSYISRWILLSWAGLSLCSVTTFFIILLIRNFKDRFVSLFTRSPRKAILRLLLPIWSLSHKTFKPKSILVCFCKAFIFCRRFSLDFSLRASFGSRFLWVAECFF